MMTGGRCTLLEKTSLDELSFIQGPIYLLIITWHEEVTYNRIPPKENDDSDPRRQETHEQTTGNHTCKLPKIAFIPQTAHKVYRCRNRSSDQIPQIARLSLDSTIYQILNTGLQMNWLHHFRSVSRPQFHATFWLGHNSVDSSTTVEADGTLRVSVTHALSAGRPEPQGSTS